MPKNFTPQDTALLLIDHQVGTMKLIKNLPLALVKRNTIALAKAARELEIPTVLTSSQEERFQGPLMSELQEILPTAYSNRIKRSGFVNAWDDPAFRTAVEGTGRKNLIMAGVTTDVCLVYPAISAVEAGYRVQAVLDAGGSPFELSEEMARQRMRSHGVVLTATITAFAELAYDWSGKDGSGLQRILFEDVLAGVVTD